ncbi:carbohydrate-binding protein [Streptomyces sp. HUAS TT7]|uniref:carbohydrate-binding protein n=1 Tax=Streptomyces sp. HUAS TT7 TaxID=3447507 RepID=UPI003F654C5D
MAGQQSPSAGGQCERPRGETASDDATTELDAVQPHSGDATMALDGVQPHGADETMVFDPAQLHSRRRRSRSARRRISAGAAGVLALAGAGMLAFGGGGPDNLAALMGSSGHGAGAPDTVPSTTPSTAEEQARSAGAQVSPNASSPKGPTPGHPSASDTFRTTPSAPGADGQHTPSTGADPSTSHAASTSSHPTSPSPSHSDGRSLPVWQAGDSYGVGDRVTYNGVVYRCRQAYVGHGDPSYIESEALWQRLR